jgi:hypothetical protein
MIETGLECRLSAQLHTQRHKRCEKRHFLRHLYLKTNISPRQARDKHRESTQKTDVPFRAGEYPDYNNGHSISLRERVALLTYMAGERQWPFALSSSIKILFRKVFLILVRSLSWQMVVLQNPYRNSKI